ncbi:MAG: leucyl aminopeptidase family protein [Methylotenera sp.]|nr:leucyl aminopeptidase family protein [Oligoflexia bacterium]
MSQFKIPTLDLSNSGAQSTHQLLLISKDKKVPGGLPKGFPEHLKNHAALEGSRGAKFSLHGAASKVFFGVGDDRTFTAQEAADWGENAGTFLASESILEVQVCFPEGIKDPTVVLNFVKGLSLAGLRVETHKTQPSKKATQLRKIAVFAPGAVIDPSDLKAVGPIVSGIAFAREIVELPSGDADPQGIIDRLKAVYDSKTLEIEVWDEKKIAKEKMGLIQAVSRGSETPPRFLVMRYKKDAPKKQSLYLVGKGVTFDTGGINIKAIDWKVLLSMKKDMGGAAAVIGAMLAISQLRPDIRVVGLTPLTTNGVGPKAIYPGDIVTSYSGKTVEIMNTDAEGRLILADALHFACREKADYIVDVATLTGACVVALGQHHSGLFSNNARFSEVVRDSSERSGEPAWPLPVSPRYGEEMKSDLADLSNMGAARDGGASLGAAFLEKFVGQTPWVHLDIAGTHDLAAPAAAGAQIKASGRMVHTLVTLAQTLADRGNGANDVASGSLARGKGKKG